MYSHVPHNNILVNDRLHIGLCLVPSAVIAPHMFCWDKRSNGQSNLSICTVQYIIHDNYYATGSYFNVCYFRVYCLLPRCTAGYPKYICVSAQYNVCEKPKSPDGAFLRMYPCL